MPEPLPEVPVETIIEKIDKPKSSSLAIRILVGLLILVILSEISYLLYNNYLKSSPTSLSGPDIQEEVVDSPPTQTTPIDSQIEEQSTESTISNLSQTAIDHYNQIISLPDILFKNALVTFTLEGEIINIITETKTVKGITYPYGINLKLDQRDLLVNFNTRESISATVSDSFNPQKEMDLKDLQVGDKISLTINTNLINNPNSNAKIFIKILE